MLLLLLLAVAGVGFGQVAVLEDFETAVPERWREGVEISRDQASHGVRSARLRFEQPRAEIAFTPLVSDWRGFDRLLFDLHSDREQVQTLSLRLYERTGGTSLDDYFEARSKVIVQKGWNHIEVKLAPLQTASFRRDLNLARIEQISLYAERTRLPWIVHADNFRLVQGAEPAETASRAEPHDTVTIIEGRWFTVRQVARPDEVPESSEVKRLRAEAAREAERLRETIRAAELQGIDTIYSERHLVTAGLGLHVRPPLPWYNNDGKKTELFRYVVESCRGARRELEDLLYGFVRLPHTDDTQVGEPLIPPYPPLKGSPIRDWFYRDALGRPMIVISLHSPSRALERFFASPRQHIESYTVGGGSRWTIEQSPVYEAFHKFPDTHRVGWDGWCGHLIRDLHSMGGSKMENVVICLESPRIREAVDRYIQANVPRFHDNPQLLYDIMAYELMYICYCDRSQRMFREWLEAKHGAVARVNEIYGAAYKDFVEITAPPVRNSRPLPGTNRALWYDWARFNMDRFTDYLLWVRSRVRQVDPTVPLAAGGSSSMLAGRTGTTGIDEERIVNEVGDIIIHEGGGSTLGVDLQLALSETKKPLADPEMALDSVYNLLPHALHGKTVMQFFHWPVQPQNEFFSINGSSLAHSWRFSLADISELIRATLDARRLTPEIGAFIDAPAEVAILYSQTATLQLPPEMLTWSTTPYLAELENTYEASRYLDAKVTFVTERQILKGWLDRYKLLLVPAVRNIPAGVVGRIWSFASRGGHVLIVPESFLGDEYNHPRDYLSTVGVVIQRTERPKPGTPGAMVQGYDQSFSQEVTLASAGRLRQIFRAPAEAKTLARYPDVVRIPLARGAVFYSGASLEERDYARLLDALYQEAGITRPLRVRTLDSETWKIEARHARLNGRDLLYAINFHDRPVRLRLEAPPASLSDLRERRHGLSGDIALLSRQTGIYELHYRRQDTSTVRDAVADRGRAHLTGVGRAQPRCAKSRGS